VIVDRWAEHLSWVVLTDGQTICDDAILVVMSLVMMWCQL
jgi:hypothetical protein